MIICFTCVFFLGKGKEENEVTSDDVVAANTNKSLYTLGVFLAMATSWVYSINAVLNRSLSNYHYVIIMFYHGLLGIILGLSLILIAPFFNNNISHYSEGITFFSYSRDQYLKMLVAVMFDTIGVNCMTIAYQSDGSGFVSLLSYISIVYAFVGDLIIFNEIFTIIQILCSFTILGIIVGVSVAKLKLKI